MIELLSKSLEGSIIKEVKRATIHLRGSALEDEAVGEHGVPRDDLAVAGSGNGNMKKVLETKINKSEINEYLKGKSSKKDTEVLMRQVSILHK
jgi:hypothetical protein